MNYIIYTVAELRQTDKPYLIKWLNDAYDLPDTIPNVKYSDNNIHLDSNHIWLFMFETIEYEMLNIYNKEYQTYNDLDFIQFCNDNYDKMNKLFKIPILKKECPKDIDIINDIIENYNYDAIMLLLLFKKLLKKDFTKINIDSLDANQIYRFQLFGIHYMLQYYNISLLSPENIQDLIDAWGNIYVYSLPWKHKKNHYIFVNRYQKRVNKLTIQNLFAYKLASANLKTSDKNINKMIDKIKNDDWVNILDTDVQSEDDIDSYDDFERVLTGYIFHIFKPATDLESAIMGCCNKYAHNNRVSRCFYKKIKKLINRKIGHQRPNLSIECIKYSYFHYSNHPQRLCCC